MKNKEEVLIRLKELKDVNSLLLSDDILGGCDDTTDGWIRCHSSVMDVMIERLIYIIDMKEAEF